MKRTLFALILFVFCWTGILQGQPLRYFTDYMYLTDSERPQPDEIVWFWSNDSLTGYVHSNDTIAIKNRPKFMGQVSSSQDTIIHNPRYYNPYFLYPPIFNLPEVEIPERIDTLQQIAVQQGHYYPNDPVIPRFARLMGYPDCWVLHQWDVGTAYDSTIVSEIDTIPYPVGDNWLALYFDGEMYLSGRSITGKNMIGAENNIWLQSDLLVEGTSVWTRGVVDEDNENMIFVLSHNNVIVSDTYENGRANGYPRCPDSTRRHITISAAIMALGNSFTIEHQNDEGDDYIYCEIEEGSRDLRGYIFLYGSLVQRKRGYVHRSNCRETGYYKQYLYDTRWFENPPPCITTPYTEINTILENDTLYVNRPLRMLASDTLIVGQGGVLVLRNGAWIDNQWGGYISIGGVEGNPAEIIQDSDFSNDPFAKLNYSEDAEWDSVWSHLILDLSCDTVSLPPYVTNTTIRSHSENTRIKVFRSDSTGITYDNLALHGHFEVQELSAPFNLNNSFIHGRFRIESETGFDHCTFAARQQDEGQPAVYSLRRTSIRNSFMYGSYSFPAQAFPQTECSVSFSGCFGMDHEVYMNYDTGDGLIFSDPYFVCPEDDDYTLLSTSPLIDNGSPDSPYDEDGTRCDIGAFSFDWREYSDTPEEQEEFLPEDFCVDGPWPNPFNGVTSLRVTHTGEQTLRIRVFDVLGREIGTVNQKHLTTGTCTVPVDLSQHPAGIYFLHIQAGLQSKIVKAVLVK